MYDFFVEMIKQKVQCVLLIETCVPHKNTFRKQMINATELN